MYQTPKLPCLLQQLVVGIPQVDIIRDLGKALSNLAVKWPEKGTNSNWANRNIQQAHGQDVVPPQTALTVHANCVEGVGSEPPVPIKVGSD
jgi:hypothetical protein